MDLPTQEELERAKKYQDKVPNYQVSSGNGQIHDGVIVDNPNFSSYLLNPSNQQPAPVGLNPNNQPNIPSEQVGANLNNQFNKIDNQDAETDSGRPSIKERLTTENFPLKPQIQEKIEKPA